MIKTYPEQKACISNSLFLSKWKKQIRLQKKGHPKIII